MIDQPITQLFGNLPLQGFEFGIDEFDDLTAFDIDKVIVVRFGGGFVTGAAIAEIMPVKNAGFLEQPYRAVDRGDRNARIFGRGARMQRFDVWMIGAARKDAR